VEVDHAKQSEEALIDGNSEVNSGKDLDEGDALSSRAGTRLVRNSGAAVLAIDWLVDLLLVDQQRLVADAIHRLCLESSWNAMQCSEAGMIKSIIRCLQQAKSSLSTLHVSVVGE